MGVVGMVSVVAAGASVGGGWVGRGRLRIEAHSAAGVAPSENTCSVQACSARGSSQSGPGGPETLGLRAFGGRPTGILGADAAPPVALGAGFAFGRTTVRYLFVGRTALMLLLTIGVRSEHLFDCVLISGRLPAFAPARAIALTCCSPCRSVWSGAVPQAWMPC